MSSGSVSHWIHLIKAGENEAAQPLWERYFQRLARFARKELQGNPRRLADEEDVALSAFDSFCRGAAEGRFPQLADRDDLWRLLLVIASRKAVNLIVSENRQKRGGGRQREPGDPEAILEEVLGREPTPELSALVAEEFERLLALLTDPSLRQVAVAKMEGYSNEEIAQQLACVPRTVERRLAMIRALWGKERP